MRRRHGNTQLIGSGTCPPCKRGDHSRCTDRARDELLDAPTTCHCRGIEHRTDNDWKAIFR